MKRNAIRNSAAIFSALALACLGTMPAQAAPLIVGPTTVNFGYTGTQGSWTVPSRITDLKVTVAGANGGPPGDPALSGAGGSVTVDLGTTYSGQTLNYLVGGQGFGSEVLSGPTTTTRPGGGGSYLATDNALLVVAGGGGASATYQVTGGGTAISPLPTRTGGNGGIATVPGDPGQGGNGARYFAASAAAAQGASGAGAGTPGISDSLGMEGYPGQSVTSVVAGIITPSLGGASPYSGAGGGGYAGGGGGGYYRLPDHTEEAWGAGGGGSGYLASGLSGTAEAPNLGDGFISFTYTLAYTPTISLSGGPSIEAGSARIASVSGLPANTTFDIVLHSTPTTIASGTSNSTGSATVAVTIPATTPPGTHTIDLAVSGTTVASTGSLTVAAILPVTGATPPWSALAFALLLAGAGIVLIWRGGRTPHCR